MLLKEDFLHFIWRFRLYDSFSLRTKHNEKLKVSHVGQYNRNAGPDFLFSRIYIDETEWNGHVEIHIDANDWYVHRHEQDPAYNNVILHVVWTGDVMCKREDGTILPVLCLSDYVKEDFLSRYTYLQYGQHDIACAGQLKSINHLLTVNWLQRMTVERLEYRYHQYIQNDPNLDWEKLTFQLLCRSFGMDVNKETFMKFSNCLDMNLLGKYRLDPIKIESMVFGQAGFLAKQVDDPYYQTIQKTFEYLKKIHQLKQISDHEWKFMRMRPSNFPTVRLAQLAALMASSTNIFSKIIAVEDYKEFNELLKGLNINPFWREHYHFEKESSYHGLALSDSFIQHLVVNCFAVVAFTYGQYIRSPHLMEKALAWLEQIAPEKNRIVNQYKLLGLNASNASETQALYHLYHHYCTKKKCLDCAIGASLLRRSD